jgi:hypothetical protein
MKRIFDTQYASNTSVMVSKINNRLMGNGILMWHFMYCLRSQLSATKFQLALKIKIINFPKVITFFHSAVDLFLLLFVARTIFFVNYPAQLQEIFSPLNISVD